MFVVGEFLEAAGAAIAVAQREGVANETRPQTARRGRELTPTGHREGLLRTPRPLGVTGQGGYRVPPPGTPCIEAEVMGWVPNLKHREG